MVIVLRDAPAYGCHELRKSHDSTAQYVAELLMAFAHIAMLEGHVGQADGFGNRGGDFNLLSDTVNEMELTVGPHYSEGDTGKSSAGTHIEEGCPVGGSQEFGGREGVEDMVDIEMVNILTGYDIDFFVPIAVEGTEGLHLLALMVGKGEVFEYFVHGEYSGLTFIIGEVR